MGQLGFYLPDIYPAIIGKRPTAGSSHHEQGDSIWPDRVSRSRKVRQWHRSRDLCSAWERSRVR
jgi:hypothetical protein